MYKLYRRIAWQKGRSRIMVYLWVDPCGVVIHERVTQPMGYVNCFIDDQMHIGQSVPKGEGFRNVTPKGDAYQGADGYLAKGWLV